MLRYIISIAVIDGDSGFPSATMNVNIVGSFVIGMIVGMSISTSFMLFICTGCLGAFTTFSTLLQLYKENRRLISLYNIFIQFACNILSAFHGYIIGHSML